MSNTGYTFKVPEDARVFILTYGAETQVRDAGQIVTGLSAIEAARVLGDDYVPADRDQKAWGRVILEGRE